MTQKYWYGMIIFNAGKNNKNIYEGKEIHLPNNSKLLLTYSKFATDTRHSWVSTHYMQEQSVHINIQDKRLQTGTNHK